MKTLKHIVQITFMILLLTACGSTPTAVPPVFQGENPYAPQPTDGEMQRDTVTIDSSMMALSKSLPPQVMLKFAYFPPTPCHELRVEVDGPDAQNRIHVTAYSVVKKDTACILMAIVTPLDASFNLGSFPSGHYSLWLNEASVGEFDS